MPTITLFDDKNAPAEVDTNSDEYRQKVAEGWTTWKKPSVKKTSKKKED